MQNPDQTVSTTEERNVEEIPTPLGRRLALFRRFSKPGRRFGNRVSVSPRKRLDPMAAACEAAAENGRSPIGSRNRRGTGGGSGCGRAAAGEASGGRA
jgi:hypothetical protein